MTEAQQRIHRAVDEIGADGWPVSVREICGKTGLSVQTVHTHLTALTAAGYLVKHPRLQSGGWRVAL